MCSLVLFINLAAWQPFETLGQQPIDPTPWLVSENIRASQDALILLDYTRITIKHIDRYRRVLILNEKGRAAAELTQVIDKIKKLNGRVMTRSGRNTTFNQKNDLIEVLATRTRRSQSRARFLVPPGLSNHCIVDMSWRVAADSGIPKGSLFWRHDIPETFPCRRKIIEISKGALRGTFDDFRTRFIWAKGHPGLNFNEAKKRGSLLLTYENVPPQTSFPFGNRFYEDHQAFFLAYKTFRFGGNTPDTFWEMFSNHLLKSSYHFRFSGSSEYQAWLGELKATLKKNPFEALLQVYDAFRQKVAHANLLPPHLRTNGSTEKEETIVGKRMNQVFHQGYGFDGDISRLFLQVLRDLDIPAKLVFSTPMNRSVFKPESLNWFDLPLDQPMFGLPIQGGNWLLVMPTRPEFSPGFVPSSYRFGQALVVDPFDEWTHGVTVLNRYEAADHRRWREYRSQLSVNNNIGRMSFSVNEKGTGVFNARFKRWFYEYPIDEHAYRLTKIWEKRTEDYRFENAKVSRGDQLSGTVLMSITGKRQFQSESESWLSINPFPGDTLPLKIPEYWPKNRTQPILLPQQLMQTDINQITVPSGWAFRGHPSWSKSNEVGKVSFIVEQEQRVIHVKRDIVIHADVLGAEFEPALKDFIAWLEEAGYQTLGLERGAP